MVGCHLSFHTSIDAYKFLLKSTIVTAIFAAALAFFMDVFLLAGMVIVGTVHAFTTVAVSLSLSIIKYFPPDELSPTFDTLQTFQLHRNHQRWAKLYFWSKWE